MPTGLQKWLDEIVFSRHSEGRLELKYERLSSVLTLDVDFSKPAVVQIWLWGDCSDFCFDLMVSQAESAASGFSFSSERCVKTKLHGLV